MSLTAKPAWLCSHSMNGRAGLVTICAPYWRLIQSRTFLRLRSSPVDPLALRSNLTWSSRIPRDHSRVASLTLVAYGADLRRSIMGDAFPTDVSGWWSCVRGCGASGAARGSTQAARIYVSPGHPDRGSDGRHVPAHARTLFEAG